MAKSFENPSNGYRETTGTSDIFGTLFFGPLWYFRRGLYAIGAFDALIYFLIIVGIANGNDNTAGFLFFIILIPLHLATASAAPSLVARHLSRLGWRELPKKSGVGPTSNSLPIEKVCPMCAETVKYAAIICKHCGHSFAKTPDIDIETGTTSAS